MGSVQKPDINDLTACVKYLEQNYKDEFPLLIVEARLYLNGLEISKAVTQELKATKPKGFFGFV
jgi:hypothetical protein